MTERSDRETDVDDDSVRSALDRILASETFIRSPKVSRLLSYLVERRLVGDEAGLREAQIAQAVFDQPQDFNPRSNPIVRVNASRLRNLLRLYYAGPGSADTQRIMLPDVGYRPEFTGMERRPEPAAPEEASPPSAGPERKASAGKRPADDTAAATEVPPSPAGLMPTAQGANAAFLRRHSMTALLFANLVLAGAFAVLAGRMVATDVHHVLDFPAEAHEGAPGAGMSFPLFMLCDRDTAATAQTGNPYPVAIGEQSFVCWPLQLREADIERNPA